MILRITASGIIKNRDGEVSTLSLPLMMTSDALSETVECATRDDLAAFLHRHNAQARCFLPGEIDQLLADYLPGKPSKTSRVRTPRKRNRNCDWMI